MQIGEVIRKYRKSKNMTQEEMANRLGVTAPAVNKWENGNSMPDIMLLAPIARLLGVTLDTLLSFREELTDEEINAIVEEMSQRFKTESYEEVFQWSNKIRKAYPNCDELLWQMTLVVDAQRLMQDVTNSEQYDDYIRDCYVRLLESHDENIRCRAADSLFGFYERNKEYAKAEECLAWFSNQNPEKKRKQAVLFSKTNRINEAYKAYEELLFSFYGMLSLVFHDMFMLAMQDNDKEKAHMLVQKQSAAAELFEMGAYNIISPWLELAVANKDAEETTKLKETMLANINSLCDFSKSPLYEHLEFKKIGDEFYTEMKDKGTFETRGRLPMSKR